MKVFIKNDITEALRYYVKNGFVIFRGLAATHHFQTIKEYVRKCVQVCKQKSDPIDYHEIAIAIINRLENSSILKSITDNNDLLDIISRILGPDIAIFNYNALWLNVPNDSNPVLNKDLHTDAWTGTSVNTIFVKFFCTDCDNYNGLVVAPGSHLQGLVPVRNRGIEKTLNIDFETINLAEIQMGDIILWHPLLLHSTAGHSDKNLRISITSRYTSTETEFSSQERALGFRTLRVGVNNQILRIIGNDNLLPLRTYGGFVGVDKRMRKIYGLSEYDSENVYNELLPAIP